MKNNLTLNEINNKFTFFWIKKIIILLLRLLGIILDNFNNKKFFFKISNNTKSFFFGYHDKKPSNYNDTKIIVHSYKNTKTLEGQSKKKIFINLIDLNNKKILNLDNTTAWSWQLGSSLQWHPKKDIIFFNKQINKNFITKQFNLKSKIIKNLKFSIYNVSPNGNNFLLADFVKIGKLRKGYGFETNKVQKFSNLKKSKLEIFNIKKNKKKLLYLFDETKNKSIIGCYINHQTFSVNGTKIAYFYTILREQNQRQIFFYYYCLKKKKNFLINISKSNLISHYCWKNND